jgi:hypothetical protein
MNNRRILATSLLSLALGLAPLGLAFAQSQPGDPPDRAGRVAEMSGTVSFHTADVTQWGPASVNYPVTGGNSFWTEPRSHAAIDVGASRIYMDSSTELDIGNIDDHSFVGSLAQGALYVRVSPAANGDQYEIDTPRGAVHISQPGDYEVIAGDADHPTTIMAFQGSAQVVGPDVSAGVDPQQAIYLSGQNPEQVNRGPAQTDDFIRFVQSQEQPYQNAGPAPQSVSPEMTGYQDLNRYGQWNPDPTYGQVWYPQVDASWAPYRDGHWAYVAPWGWTWVDDAPWGFTPFHYGRWVQVRNRWAWWPGTVAAQPVYAPALVSFFGGIGGLNVGISIGQSVGWIPLGPEEVYVPPYRHSDRYVRNVNVRYVHNETTIINVVNNTTVINNYNNYHNRNGATVVDGATMTGSRPVAPEFHKIAPNGKLDGQRWADAKPINGNPPVKPTDQTRGFNGYKPPVSPGPNLGNGQNGPDKNKYGQNNHQNGGQNNAQNQNGQNNNGQGKGPTIVGGAKLPPLKPGNGQTGNGQVQNGQNQNGQNQNGKNQTGNGQAPAALGGANGKQPPLVNGQQPGNGQFGQNQNGNGQNGNGQNGNNQNNKNLKIQNNGQIQNGQNQGQGQGQATGNGSNTKLPPLPPGQQPGQGQFGQGQNGQINNGQNNNGQFQNGQNGNGQNHNGQNQGTKITKNGTGTPGPATTIPPKNGNQSSNFGQNQNQKNSTQNSAQPKTTFVPQGQNQQNQQNLNNQTHSGNGFAPQGNGQNQKVQHKQQNGKGIIPPVDNGAQHKQ